MGLKLLGPLELVVDRQLLDFGGPRQRVVLSMLALNANRVTPVDQLIDAVWGSSPPLTARGQIQICISGLRKVFGEQGQPGAIRTRPPGYLLEISPDELDSEEFARLVNSARAEAEGGQTVEAAETLRNALALWRGPALAGIDSDLVRRGAALLEDHRLAAIEERIRLDLANGRHEELSGELAALISEFPLRERLYEFLMLALYRSGRQAEALEVSRRARNTLIEELGIEPGQKLQDLATSILNRDTALELRPISAEQSSTNGQAHAADQPVYPRQLPASIADFTGRETHIAEIMSVLCGEPGPVADPYAMRIVAISGKGGVGKSCLAIRAAHALSDQFPDGHLYADLGGPNGMDRTPMVLARFLRALGVLGKNVPDDRQERAEMYRTRIAGKRMLIVLDDVTSEQQVMPLLPGTSGCAVIATSRMRLTLPGARLIDAEVFDAEHSMELLARIVGEDRLNAEETSAVQLIELCGGLPLALRIAGAKLASKPHWRIAALVRRLADEVRGLDEFSHHGLELRSSIGLTYRTLSSESKRLFRLFALIQAPDFPTWTAAALLDTDVLDAEIALESLVDAQLVDTIEYPGERIRYRFHNLIRAYALERLVETETLADRDGAFQRLLGGWLSLAETAHRREHGGDYSILHGVAPRWQPMDSTGADLIDEPVEWWETERRALVAAVRQAAAAGLHELCWDLALTLVSLFEVKGYFDDWRETAELGLAATKRAGNRTGEAAMLYSLGYLHMTQRRLAEADQCFGQALQIFNAEGNTHGRALVLRDSAIVDRLHGRSAGMLAKYEESLAMMREVGDPVGEAHVLQSLARYTIDDDGDIERSRQYLDRALRLVQQAKYSRGEAQVMNRFAELYLSSGQIELARQALHRVLLIVRDIGDRIGEAHALYGLGVSRHREGRLDIAETTLVHALSLARRIGERFVEGKTLYALGEIDLARGRTSAGATHLAEARQLFGELDSTLWHAKTLMLLSEVHAADGEAGMASKDVEQAARMLSGVESRAADQLLVELEKMRSALLADTR
jgi:DNA-binding SARP family transcriptional activator/tetratricopeptide (TPR) repeat protein